MYFKTGKGGNIVAGLSRDDAFRLVQSVEGVTRGGKRPNVLMYVLDDMSADYVSAYNPLFVDKDGASLTPNLDAFCGEGMRWKRCYTNAPICQSSRWHLNTGSYQLEYGPDEGSQDSPFIPRATPFAYPAKRFKSAYMITTLSTLPTGAAGPAGASVGSGYTEAPTVLVNGQAIGPPGLIPTLNQVQVDGDEFQYMGFVHMYAEDVNENTFTVSEGNATLGYQLLPMNGVYHVKPYMFGDEMKIMHRYLRESGYHTAKLMKDNYGLDNTNGNVASYDYLDKLSIQQGVYDNGDHQGVYANFDISSGRLLDPSFQTFDDGLIRNSWSLNRDPDKPFFVQVNDYNVHQSTITFTTQMLMTVVAGVQAGGDLTALLTQTGLSIENWEDWLYFSGNSGAQGTFTYMFPWAAASAGDMRFKAWMWAVKEVKKIGDRDFKHVMDLLKGHEFSANGIMTESVYENVYDDTLVVVTGDHGTYDPIGKYLMTHHSLHVPLVMKWPSTMVPPRGFEAGGETDALVSFVDFYRTFARVCKCDEPLPAHVRGVAFMDQNAVYPDPQPFVFASRPEGAGNFEKQWAIIGKEYMYVRSPTYVEGVKSTMPGNLVQEQFTQGDDFFSFDHDDGTIKTFAPADMPWLHLSAMAFASGASTGANGYLWTQTPLEALYPVPTDFTYSTHFTDVGSAKPGVLAAYRKRCLDMVDSFARQITYNGTSRTVNFAKKQNFSYNFTAVMATSSGIPNLGIALAPLYTNMVANLDLDSDGLPFTANFYGLGDAAETFEDVLSVSESQGADGGKDLIVSVNSGYEGYTAVYAKKSGGLYDDVALLGYPSDSSSQFYERNSLAFEFLGRLTFRQERVTLFGPNSAVTPETLGGANVDVFIKGSELVTQHGVGGGSYDGLTKYASVFAPADGYVVVSRYRQAASGLNVHLVMVCDSAGVGTAFYLYLEGVTLTGQIPERLNTVAPFADIESGSFEISDEGADKALKVTMSLWNTTFNMFMLGEMTYRELDTDNYRKWYWQPVPSNGIVSISSGESVLVKAEQVAKRDTEVRSYDDNFAYSYTVTVSGSSNFLVNGVENGTIDVVAGSTVIFDQSDATNISHPLRISDTADGTHVGGTEIGVGAIYVGTPGDPGSYVEFWFSTSGTYYYYCGNHSGMGGVINVA